MGLRTSLGAGNASMPGNLTSQSEEEVTEKNQPGRKEVFASQFLVPPSCKSLGRWYGALVVFIQGHAVN